MDFKNSTSGEFSSSAGHSGILDRKDVERRSLTLEAIVAHAARVESIPKASLNHGDWVVVETKNSTYSIMVNGDSTYSVSGGWFDRQGLSPHRVAVNGCTWGGSAIKHDVVASPGLFLEFGNGVITTRIQQVRVMKHDTESTVH